MGGDDSTSTDHIIGNGIRQHGQQQQQQQYEEEGITREVGAMKSGDSTTTPSSTLGDKSATSKSQRGRSSGSNKTAAAGASTVTGQQHKRKEKKNADNTSTTIGTSTTSTSISSTPRARRRSMSCTPASGSQRHMDNHHHIQKMDRSHGHGKESKQVDPMDHIAQSERMFVSRDRISHHHHDHVSSGKDLKKKSSHKRLNSEGAIRASLGRSQSLNFMPGDHDEADPMSQSDINSARTNDMNPVVGVEQPPNFKDMKKANRRRHQSDGTSKSSAPARSASTSPERSQPSVGRDAMDGQSNNDNAHDHHNLQSYKRSSSCRPSLSKQGSAGRKSRDKSESRREQLVDSSSNPKKRHSSKRLLDNTAVGNVATATAKNNNDTMENKTIGSIIMDASALGTSRKSATSSQGGSSYSNSNRDHYKQSMVVETDASERDGGKVIMDASSQNNNNKHANDASDRKTSTRRSGSNRALKSDGRTKKTSKRSKEAKKPDSPTMENIANGSTSGGDERTALASDLGVTEIGSGPTTEGGSGKSMHHVATEPAKNNNSNIKDWEHKAEENTVVEGDEEKDGKSLSMDKEPAFDFGHLPDFQVDDFSFKDLAFAFDSKTAFDFPLTGNQDSSQQQDGNRTGKSSVEKDAKIPANAADVSPPNNATPHTKPKPVAWICENCHEQHDEPELQFCGMCGTEHKPMTTPTVKKAVRKPSSRREGDSVRRQGSHTSSDGTSTVRSNGSKRSPKSEVSPTRPSSAPGVRRVRSRDKLTTRSKYREEKTDKNEDMVSEAPDAMVVKCLDGDGIQTVDIHLLNEQFTTFESMETPTTPAKVKKQLIRRSQSDVVKVAAGRSTMGTPPQTFKSGKVKGTMKRSQSFAAPQDAPTTPIGFPLKAAVRQSIPRRAKSTSNDYLQQLQQKNQTFANIGGISENLAGNSAHSDAQSAQSAGGRLSVSAQPSSLNTGRPSLASTSGRPSLAGVRPSMIKTASQRFLGGLVKSQKTVESALALTGISQFTKPKGDAVLLSSDDEGDEQEFANDGGFDSINKKKDGETGMLRDFNRGDTGLTKSPRPSSSSRNLVTSGVGVDNVVKSPRRPHSSRNILAADLSGDDAMKTPRRSRPSLGIHSNRGGADATSEGGLRTPRRNRGSIEMRSKSMDESATGPQAGRARAMRKKGSNQAAVQASGALDYEAIDIDVEDAENTGETTEEPTGFVTTPRRARERLAQRPIPRRDGGALLAKSDHSTGVAKCPLTARSRIRRMSLTAIDRSEIQAVPDLQHESKAPPVPSTPKGGLSARDRIRKASLGHLQVDIVDESLAAKPSPANVESPSELKSKDDTGVDQARTLRQAGRPGRARRRASVGASEAILKQALAHVPQDLTHAVRVDLKEEWKRQEQIEDMRNKAQQLQKRYIGGFDAPASAPLASEEAVFDASFNAHFFEDSNNPTNVEAMDDEEGSGPELELVDDDQNLSDLSSPET